MCAHPYESSGSAFPGKFDHLVGTVDQSVADTRGTTGEIAPPLPIEKVKLCVAWMENASNREK